MNNKERILASASEILLTEGLQGLSVRAISRRAGLSTIAIYSHFKGKDGVLDELYIQGFQAVYAAVEEADKKTSADDAAMLACAKYLEFAHTHQAQYRLIFGASDGHFEPSGEARKTAILAFDRLVALARRLLPEAASRREQQAAALRFWAILHGFVSLRQNVIGATPGYGSWHKLVMAAVADEVHRLRERRENLQ